MATKKKAAPKPAAKRKAPAKKKPAVTVSVVDNGDGTFAGVVLDEDGKELARYAEGSRNPAYPRRVVTQEHPDLPLS